MGLSPHIRGNVQKLFSILTSIGSIPAHTGERWGSNRDSDEKRVYPRTYGGTEINSGIPRIHTGLSPHIRGNAPCGRMPTRRKGSIPAHTGERAISKPPNRMSWVYPRTYGGTRWMNRVLRCEMGLSPHIRGNVESLDPPLLYYGSIPAHTGERHESFP